MRFVTACLALSIASLAEAQPQFRDDYESGEITRPPAGQLRKVKAQVLHGAAYETPPRAAAVPAPAPLPGRPGRLAARFVLEPSDPMTFGGHRSELCLPGGDAIGGTWWYAISIYVPSGPLYQPVPGAEPRESEVIYTQWHHADTPNAAGLSPAVAFAVWQVKEEGKLTAPFWTIAMREVFEQGVAPERHPVYGAPREQHGRAYFSRSRPRAQEPRLWVQQDSWTDFVLQVRWSPESSGPRAGFVRCWVVDRTHPEGVCFEDVGFKTYPADIPVGPYLKWGIYKYPWKASSHVPASRAAQTVYIDEVACYRDDDGRLSWRDVAPRR